jgi:hypothetical protein
LVDCVAQGINIDETHKTDVMVAFSYYEVFSAEDREKVKEALNLLSIEEVLRVVLMNNEPLFETIETLKRSNVAVIEWIQFQIERGKKMLEVFDGLIAEGKRYE